MIYILTLNSSDNPANLDYFLVIHFLFNLIAHKFAVFAIAELASDPSIINRGYATLIIKSATHNNDMMAVLYVS